MQRGLRRETVLVLGVSLGSSAVYAVLSIIEKLTRPVPLVAADDGDEPVGDARTGRGSTSPTSSPASSCRSSPVALALYLLNHVAPARGRRARRPLRRPRPPRAGPRPAPRARPRRRHRHPGARLLLPRQGDRHQHPGLGGQPRGRVVVGPGARPRGHRERPPRGGHHGRLPLHALAPDRMVVAARHRRCRP